MYRVKSGWIVIWVHVNRKAKCFAKQDKFRNFYCCFAYTERERIRERRRQTQVKNLFWLNKILIVRMNWLTNLIEEILFLAEINKHWETTEILLTIRLNAWLWMRLHICFACFWSDSLYLYVNWVFGGSNVQTFGANIFDYVSATFFHCHLILPFPQKFNWKLKNSFFFNLFYQKKIPLK